MGTQAVISIIENGKTKIKVVCGCEGYNAPKLAAKIKHKIKHKRLGPNWIHQVYDLALETDFGCRDCLVVSDQTDHLFYGDVSALHPRYREKFDDPEFNPRWEYGTADYVLKIEIPTDHGSIQKG